jgi:hypothetical protein
MSNVRYKVPYPRFMIEIKLFFLQDSQLVNPNEGEGSLIDFLYYFIINYTEKIFIEPDLTHQLQGAYIS